MIRKEPCEHTPEDQGVWWDVILRLFSRQHYSFGQVLYTRSLMQDTCDALHMNWAQTIRRPRAGGYRMLGPLDNRVSIADPNPIDYGGDIRRFIHAPEHPK